MCLVSKIHPPSHPRTLQRRPNPRQQRTICQLPCLGAITITPIVRFLLCLITASLLLQQLLISDNRFSPISPSLQPTRSSSNSTGLIDTPVYAKSGREAVVHLMLILNRLWMFASFVMYFRLQFRFNAVQQWVYSHMTALGANPGNSRDSQLSHDWNVYYS